LEIGAGKTFERASSLAHPNGEQTRDQADMGSMFFCHFFHPPQRMPPMPAAMARSACMFADSILLRNAGRKYVLNMNNCPIARLKMSHLPRQFPDRSYFHFRPHNGHRKSLNEPV
jgi:hypothetical protein